MKKDIVEVIYENTERLKKQADVPSPVLDYLNGACKWLAILGVLNVVRIIVQGFF